MRKASKKAILISLVLVSVIAAVFIKTMENSHLPFSDISRSEHKDAIITLHENNIVVGQNDHFRPEDILTKEEAAMLISKVFKIAPVQAFDYQENPKLKKEYAYSYHLGAVSESFMVAEAKDAVDSSEKDYIEGILNANIASTQDGAFYPSKSISGKDFSQMIANAVYGINSVDHSLERGIQDGFLYEDMASSNDDITRESAARVLANILNNENFKIITIFATSDIHGHLDPYTPSGSNVSVGSLEKMSYIINNMRTIQPNLLLLDGGDSPYNTNISNIFTGKSTIDVMNAMGYDATVLGNHDFDFSFDILRENAKRANYPFLSVNTYWEDGKYPDEFKKSIIKEVDGLSVAIIGATDDSSATYTHYANTQDIIYHEQFETTKQELEQLKDRADLVVVLSHLHNNNPVLLDKVSGIDISIGGGNDLMGQPVVKDDTWLINPGKHAECLNQINVNMLNSEKIGVVFSQIVMNPDMPADQKIVDIVDGYKRELDEKMINVIGKTDVDLDAERGTVRLKESNLANAVADSLKEYFEADVAFQNGGGVRASIPKGDITMGNIFEALPFDNRLILIETSGKTIQKALENGVAIYPDAAGQFLQVSGLTYTFDAEKPVGQKITEIKVGNGALDLEKTYKMVINDFMAGGGDGYTMLKCLGNDAENYASDVKLLVETNDFLRDVFQNYVAKKGTIAPQNEGRITIINAVN